MTAFAYTAIPLQGPSARLVSGQRDAPDERELRDALRRAGLVAIDVRPVHLWDAVRASLARDRLRRGDAVWFFQTLRLLLASAVPLESALGTMHELAPRPRLRRACGSAREQLRAGASLADALSPIPGLARARDVALLRSGLESGRLAHAVALVDASLGGSERLRRALIGRLIYPAILLLAAVGALWFLASVVLPQFAQTLQSLGGELPLATRLTMDAARVLAWALPILAIAAILFSALGRSLVTPALRARASRWALRIPVLGDVLWHAQAAAATDVMATMVEGGSDVLSAMGQAQDVVSLPVLGERLARARQQVREGADPGQALEASRALPPLIAAMVRVGVKGGEFAPALRRASSACLERQERLTERLLIVMEPLVVLFLAGTVGWVVYALIMGMLAMNDLQTV